MEGRWVMDVCTAAPVLAVEGVVIFQEHASHEVASGWS